jgi:ubiquinone biosynthesis accessory factor UbiJ
MTDPTWLMALCSALEAAVNTALRYDPGSRQALGRLSGRVLAVELTSPHLRFYLLPHAEGLTVQSQYEGKVDTCLKGSPMALAALLQSERLNLTGSGVEVFGQTGLLLDLQRITRNLDIDWEEALSQIVGDVAGHGSANALRKLSAWAKGRKTTFEHLLGEYLSEELKTTPARAELEHYYREVDTLRLATDRLAAKIEALESARLKRS